MVESTHQRGRPDVKPSHNVVFARTGFRHLRAIEARLEAEFGEDYEAARRVLEQVAQVLDDIPGAAHG